MKSMVLTGIRQMQLIDVPKPEILNPFDVLIKLKVVAVCGSDLHYYTTGRIGSQVVQFPFAVGHECAGIVEAVGSLVKSVGPGDRIAIEPAMTCGECDQCKSGRENTCRSIKFLGCPGQAEGALQEYMVMPEKCCFKVSDKLNMDEAALSEPLTIGVYAVKRSIPMEGATVGILGFGPIGFSVLTAAIAAGAKAVYVTDKIEERLHKAKQAGAKYAGNPDNTEIEIEILKQEPLGLDVVFECCGQHEAIDNAFHLLKPGGKLMVIGIPEFDRWSIPVDIARRNEITIVNVRRQNHSLEETLDGLESGKYNVDAMVTHRFPLAKAKDAFDLLDKYADGVMKVMIDFD